VSNSTQCELFIGDGKKYTVFGVTYSFKGKPESPHPRPARQKKKGYYTGISLITLHENVEDVFAFQTHLINQHYSKGGCLRGRDTRCEHHVLKTTDDNRWRHQL